MITGFPSPAQGYEHNQMDFNSYIIKHPSATVVRNAFIKKLGFRYVWGPALRKHSQSSTTKKQKSTVEVLYIILIRLMLCLNRLTVPLSGESAFAELPRLTSYTPDLVNAARLILPHIYHEGYGYKVIMVTLLDIMPAQYQGWLWIDPKEDIKKRKLMEAVDTIANTYGRRSITLAKSWTKTGWEMKREFLSPMSISDNLQRKENIND